MPGPVVVAFLMFSLGLAAAARAGDGEGEGEPAGCVPGCIDASAERLCSGAGAQTRLPCAADERCVTASCEVDPALAGSAGGCNCNDDGDRGSALGAAGVAGVVLPSWRRRRGWAINASSRR